MIAYNYERYCFHLVVFIDILESLSSFCPKVVVTLRSIQSYASKLLAMMTMMTMISVVMMMLVVVIVMMVVAIMMMMMIKVVVTLRGV